MQNGELLKLKEKLLHLEESIEKLQKNLEELKKNDFVMSYIYTKHEYESNLKQAEDLREKILYQELLICDHYFVINDVKSDFDGHRTDRTNIMTCIKCGITNSFFNYYDEDLSSKEKIMKEIFNGNNCYWWPKHGYYSYDEIPMLKDIYEKFVKEYPDATDLDVEKHIEFVKKMKGGKLC